MTYTPHPSKRQLIESEADGFAGWILIIVGAIFGSLSPDSLLPFLLYWMGVGQIGVSLLIYFFKR